ncbi:MAG: DegT/DnrJ/EryC1/StrS family aminotransferase [Pseudomonadota bacterium]
MTPRFEKSFTQQEPVPEEAIEAAVAVMRSGRLHRYNVEAGETSETALLEAEFAASLGVPFCLATASGGTAMQIALGACGVAPGEAVLTNAFTLSPVPGAIRAAGARSVLVETTEALVIDLDDLARKAEASGARFLLLSHMRGHLADMDALVALCCERGIAIIEDCAHTMGAAWAGRPSGTFGLAACFSTQTYKHINSGEGGFVTTADPDVMARAIIRSGSYMLYERHLAAPGPERFAEARLDMPNCSSRMDNLRAAILRPQLRRLGEQVERWNARYRAVEDALRGTAGVVLREIPNAERHVGSSIQFRLPALTDAGVAGFLAATASRGVELKWFGAAEPHGYTSNHRSWRYAGEQSLAETDRILSRLFDMRIPLTFSEADCRQIGAIIADCAAEALAPATAG